MVIVLNIQILSGPVPTIWATPMEHQRPAIDRHCAAWSIAAPRGRDHPALYAVRRIEGVRARVERAVSRAEREVAKAEQAKERTDLRPPNTEAPWTGVMPWSTTALTGFNIPGDRHGEVQQRLGQPLTWPIRTLASRQ